MRMQGRTNFIRHTLFSGTIYTLSLYVSLFRNDGRLASQKSSSFGGKENSACSSYPSRQRCDSQQKRLKDELDAEKRNARISSPIG